MRRAARTDGTHAAIVQALRQVGCQVLDLSMVGRGCPDLLVRATLPYHERGRVVGGEPVIGVGSYRKLTIGSRIIFMEVKTARGKLTQDQKRFVDAWPETIVVRSVSEALAAVGVEE